jgi:hypothetical protein
MSAFNKIRWISIKNVFNPVLICIIYIYPFLRNLPYKSTPSILLFMIVPAHFNKESISKISNDYL